MDRSLYLVPTFIGREDESMLPARTLKHIHALDTFIVEREKSARAFLKNIEHPTAQADFKIHELDKHQDYNNFKSFFDAQIKTGSIGLLSEAGMPGIADPGAEIVAYAHAQGVQVIPLAGSSSIFLALAASGMNGQQFTFHGYLPIQKGERIKTLRTLERDSFLHSQVFIEAPYRNNNLLEDLKKNLDNNTQLCIACALESEEEFIKTLYVKDIDLKAIDLHKKPCIFIIHRK